MQFSHLLLPGGVQYPHPSVAWWNVLAVEGRQPHPEASATPLVHVVEHDGV